MKNLLQKAALVFAISLAPVALHAQTQTISYGRTTVKFDPAFLQNIAGMAATLTDLDGNVVTAAGTTFRMTNGVLDPNSAAGEISHSGGFTLTAGTTVVRLQSFVIDTTNLSQPTITVLVTVNNTMYGRIPLFGLSAPPGFSLPFPVVSGTVQLNNVGIYFTATGASSLNTILGASAVQAGTIVGTESQYVVFSSL